MNTHIYNDFRKGVIKAMELRGYKVAKEFAKGLMHPVTLSRNLNDDFIVMREDKREAVAEKLGMTEDELIALGSDGGDKLAERIPVPPSAREKQTPDQTVDIGSDNLLEQATHYHNRIIAISEAYKEKDKNQREEIEFLRKVLQFISLPVRVCDEKKEIVFANMAYKRNIGLPGDCESCRKKDCCDRGTGATIFVEREIEGKTYQLACSPVFNNSGEVSNTISVYTDITKYVK